jgi:jumonji domain-containing protein 2
MPGEVRRLPNGWNPNQAKVYRPTWNEFKDFNGFIKMIEKDGADELGICKVIPPKEWIPRKKGYKIDELDFTIDRPVLQRFTAVN